MLGKRGVTHVINEYVTWCIVLGDVWWMLWLCDIWWTC